MRMGLSRVVPRALTRPLRGTGFLLYGPVGAYGRRPAAGYQLMAESRQDAKERTCESHAHQ
jgi:hypothetical protein